jgi:uncharacterized protein (UPF0332 family)
MAIKPIAFLESAKRELKNNDEIAFRNAISRAYYAAYHSCLVLDAMLPNHGGIKQNVGSHKQFISKLTNFPVASDELANLVGRKVKGLGYVINQSKTARHKADYELNSEITAIEADEQIIRSEKILERLEEIISALTAKQQIRAN